MRFKQWVLMPVTLFLSACFGGDMDVVKKTVTHEVPQYTLDQLLTKRQHCSETAWRSFQDDRGRKIVEYSCVYAPAKAYLADLTNKSREDDRKESAAHKVHTQNILNEKKNALQRGSESLQKARDLLVDSEKPTEAKIQLEKDLELVLGITSCADIDANKFKHQQVITQARAAIASCERDAEQVRSTCSRSDKAKWAGACNHVQEEARQRSVSTTRGLVFAVKAQLGVEQRRVPELQASTKRTIDRLESEIPIYEAELKKYSVESEVNLVKHAARSKEFNDWLDRRTAAFKNVTEISQWTVMEGHPVHVGSRVNVNFGDAVVGSEVPIDFVFQNALDKGSQASALYQVLLRALFSKFENERG